MTIIRYVDIYKTEDTENGTIDIISVKNATLPIILEADRIGPIQPYFTKTGKMFKNVSYINYDGELMKVVGNYKELNNKIKNYNSQTRPIIKGFNQHG